MKFVWQTFFTLLSIIGTTTVAANPITSNAGGLFLQTATQNNLQAQNPASGYNPLVCEVIPSPGDFFELTYVMEHRFLHSESCAGSELSPSLQQLVQLICCSFTEPEPVLLIDFFPDPLSNGIGPLFSRIGTIWNSSLIYNSGDWNHTYHTINFRDLAYDPPGPNPDEELTISIDTPIPGRSAFWSGSQSVNYLELQVTASNNNVPAMIFLSVDNGGLGVCDEIDKTDCKLPEQGDMSEGDTLSFRPNTDIWIAELVFSARYPGEKQNYDNDSIKRMNVVFNSLSYNIESRMDKDKVNYVWRPAKPHFVPGYTSFKLSHFREGFSLSSMQLYTAEHVPFSYCLDCGESSVPEPATFALLLLGMLAIAISKQRRKRIS